ncbi:unnamed protein product [Diamesa hyperborea]
MKRTITTPTADASSSKKVKSEKTESSALIESIKSNRLKAAADVLEFKFNKKRVSILSDAKEIDEGKKGIIYWMSRDMRVQDNWAFLQAQKLALKNELPLHVVFCLAEKFLDATLRHYKFMINGLEEVSEECHKLNINFHLLRGDAGEQIPKFVKEFEIGAVVVDFSPLRIGRGWIKDVMKKLDENIPFVQVDAHNIVPIWEASEKQEYAARTIRNKINNQLKTYLTEFPPVIKHPHNAEKSAKSIDWEKALNSVKVDTTVGEVDWIKPGYKNSINMLDTFVNKRLALFATKRNDPLVTCASNLSPYFHFGQLSVQRSVLEVQKYKSKHSESVASFCEEAIVRRELSDNFCYHNKNYDNIKGSHDWAAKTLNDHRKDKRPYLYTRDELDQSKTHDDLWNSAQIQLIKEGKMHGFLRMYWAKKILEWTTSPEEALSFAIYLNDRYSLDGRDPNGYVGCMWSICGIHDQGWAERAVFGKIRYMNYDGCKRKFKIDAFISRYGGKVHRKK